MSFQAMDVVVQFGEAAPVTITATEETPSTLRTPGEDTLALVTTVVDAEKDIVRVRVMKNANRVRPGVVQGEVLDEVTVGLGQSVKTTKLVENFTITITRVGIRRAR